MLNTYLADTRLLLNDAIASIYLTGTLTGYINRARNYIAALGECVRDLGTNTVTLASDELLYVDFVPAHINSNSDLINLRSFWVASGPMIDLRPYEWWTAYARAYAIGATERVGSLYNQGNNSGLTGGRIFIKSGASISLPYSIVADAIWLPIPLVDDTTVENIPDLWRDAVCYYAAFLAYMQSQRHIDAGMMMQQFERQLLWARRGVTPSQTPEMAASIGGRGTQAAGSYGSLASIGAAQANNRGA